MKHSNSNTLLFTLEYPPFKGGVANVYGNIAKHWPSYASSYAKASEDKKASDGKGSGSITVLTGKKLVQPHWLISFFYLLKEVKKNKIKTVLVGHILPLGTVTWLLAKVLSFKYVVFLHGMDIAQTLKVKRKKKLARWILRDAERIIAFNSYTAGLVQKNFGNEISVKVVVVNPGVTEMKNAELKIKNQLIQKYSLKNKIILLQVGRLVERKGFDKVLEVLPEVARECPEVVYVIVGDGLAISNIQYLISKYKLDNAVLLITNASDDELNAWYDLCDMFIMVSRDVSGDVEGFGIVYLEANAHGKPVIAGRSGGVGDAVKNDLNGILVDPNSTDEIKNAIIKLCQDEFLRRRMGQGGWEWARNFAWRGQVEKIRKILHI